MYKPRFSPSQQLISIASVRTQDLKVSPLYIFKTMNPTHYYGYMNGELWHLTKNEVDNKIRTFIRLAHKYGQHYNESEVTIL